jgi:hypothetical protein
MSDTDFRISTSLSPEVWTHLRFSEVGSMDPIFVKSHQGLAWSSFSTIFFGSHSPNYNNNSCMREPSIKILPSWSNWLVDYIYILLGNISLKWKCHHCRWRAVKLGLCSVLRTFEQGRGSKSSLSCHTCFDTGCWSHPWYDAIPLCCKKRLNGGPAVLQMRQGKPRPCITAEGVAR